MLVFLSLARSRRPAMRFGFAALVLFCATSVAHATTVTVGGTVLANEGQVSSVAGSTTVNFNALSNGGPQSFAQGIAQYTNLFIATGTGVDLVNDLTKFASAGTGQAGDLTLNFSQPITYFGLYWGSPDPLNTITLFRGANSIFTFTGQNLANQFGVPLGISGSAYVNFTASAGENYTRIVISPAGSFPFESDNQAFIAATPEPGAGLLAAAGLGIILTVRRKLGSTGRR
jgi:hypothetical protein